MTNSQLEKMHAARGGEGDCTSILFAAIQWRCNTAFP
jgi:hypothetical protein